MFFLKKNNDYTKRYYTQWYNTVWYNCKYSYLFISFTTKGKNYFFWNLPNWKQKLKLCHQKIRILTIKQAQQIVDQWISDNGVRYFNELTNMAILTEEVGEVARIISRKYGEQSFKEKESQVDLGDELADVLFVLICLANQTGVDLTSALEKNLKKKTNRDSQRHKNNQKLKQ